MKSFIKNIRGGVKLASLSLPFVILAGTAAGFAGIIADNTIKLNSFYDEVRNTEIVQELIEKEKANIENSFENNDHSLEEYTKRTSYIESTEFLKDALKSDERLQDYANREHKILTEPLYGLTLSVPMILGVYSLVNLFMVDKKYKKIIESAKKDFEDAKQIAEEKKLEKELNEYSEEIS